MSTFKTTHVDGYAAIVVNGSVTDIVTASAVYQAIGLSVEASAPTSLILQDVRDEQLQEIYDIAEVNNVEVVGRHGRRSYLSRKRLPTRKAFRLSLESGKWYFSEHTEDTYPLVYIRDVKIEKVRNGDTGDEEAQIFDVELLGADEATPTRVSYNSRDLAQFGLRPATADDFSERDMIPPPGDQLATAMVEGAPNKLHLANFRRGQQ